MWVHRHAVTAAVLQSIRGDLPLESFVARLRAGGFEVNAVTMARWESATEAPDVGDYHQLEAALGWPLGAALLRQVRTIDALVAAGLEIRDSGTDTPGRVPEEATVVADFVDHVLVTLGQLT